MSKKDQGAICQIFVYKNESGSKADTCPTTMEDLKPFSFKGVSADNDYKNNKFPSLFLLAIKYKNKTSNNSLTVNRIDLYAGNNTTSSNAEIMELYHTNDHPSFNKNCLDEIKKTKTAS